jgi:tetratricopeptide (TPR) repeat protein
MDDHISLNAKNRMMIDIINTETADAESSTFEELWEQIEFAIAPFEDNKKSGDNEELLYWYRRANEISKQYRGKPDMRIGALLFYRNFYSLAKPILAEGVANYLSSADDHEWWNQHMPFICRDLAIIAESERNVAEAEKYYLLALKYLPATSDSSCNAIRADAWHFFLKQRKLSQADKILHEWPGIRSLSEQSTAGEGKSSWMPSLSESWRCIELF